MTGFGHPSDGSAEGTSSPAASALPSRRFLWGAGLALVALAVYLAASLAEQADRVVQVHVACSGDECSVRIGDGEPLRVASSAAEAGERIGLYAYGSTELEVSQYFRGFVFEPQEAGAAPVVLPLLSAGERERLTAGEGWTVEPGRGLTWHAKPDKRSTAIVRGARAREFVVRVELDSPVDAGLLLRATGSQDGLLLAVRGMYNDVLFCPLEDGRVGHVLAIAPMRELTAGREGLRLAGLVARLGLLSAALVFLLRWIARRASLVLRPSIRAHAPLPFIAGLLVATFAAHAFVASQGMRLVPHIEDEAAYLFQAKIFAAGRTWMPLPTHPDFFVHDHIIQSDGRWFGKYPPLFPLLLAASLVAGSPWFLNPLLGALTGLAIYGLARELADWRWGLVAWSLTLASPFFLILGGSLMSHMLAALCTSLFLLALVRGTGRGSLPWMCLAGSSIGAAFLTRPYVALLVGIAGGIYAAPRVLRGTDRRRAGLAAAAGLACLAPFVLVYLGWNALQSGHASANLYSAYDGTDLLGFGPERGRGWLMTWGTWGHTPAKALRSVWRYLDYTSGHLLGWPLGLSFALALAGGLGRPRRAERWLLAGVFGMLVGGHMLYWATQHLGYGARYWFSAVPGLMVLSALGLRDVLTGGTVEPGVDTAIPRSRLPLGALATAGLVAALVGWNFGVYFPAKFAELSRYGGVDDRLTREVHNLQLQHALIFVRLDGQLFNDGFFLNDPQLEGERIFARDLGERNVELTAAYPDRRAWRWDGDRLEPLGSAAAARSPKHRRRSPLPGREGLR